MSAGGAPALRLADEDGVTRARFSTHRDGSPYLEFYDEQLDPFLLAGAVFILAANWINVKRG